MSEEELKNMRHSLAHLLAAAVLELYPGTKRAIGPAIENGFYYDFEFKEPISEDALPKIEAKMREILPTWKHFKGEEVTESEAKERFKSEPYKLKLINELAEKNEPLTVYTSGNYSDLCRGGHVENTEHIKPNAFALTSLAGAYWRGDEKNAMLTRIYGIAFDTKGEFQKYRAMLEEAKKRDHKKLGPELDLFTFSNLIGGGLPLFTPKGTLVRNLLDDFVWQLRKEHGYMRVDIPHITKKDLYEKSGHWEKFKDELFKIESREGHLFAMKPMNCPHHTQIYNRKLHSYRELPQRYANTTKVYRDEQTGELAGLSRVRSITQDDAHVFCRYDQAADEALKIWDIVNTFYSAAGFDLRIRLSLHDPDNFDAYLGTPELWKKAEDELRKVIQEKNADAVEAKGEAAFYGPKVDFIARDSLEREWQLATIQLDLNLPERFDLVCINEKGERERIVMIHAAIMGSVERYLAILIEHFAGAFPLWLAPVQVAVATIGEKQNAYGQGVCDELRSADIRAELYDQNETIGKKIREAETNKIPYLAVVGEKEQHAGTVSVRKRGDGDTGAQRVTEFIKTLEEEIRKKKLR